MTYIHTKTSQKKHSEFHITTEKARKQKQETEKWHLSVESARKVQNTGSDVCILKSAIEDAKQRLTAYITDFRGTLPKQNNTR